MSSSSSESKHICDIWYIYKKECSSTAAGHGGTKKAKEREILVLLHPTHTAGSTRVIYGMGEGGRGGAGTAQKEGE